MAPALFSDLLVRVVLGPLEHIRIHAIGIQSRLYKGIPG